MPTIPGSQRLVQARTFDAPRATAQAPAVGQTNLKGLGGVADEISNVVNQEREKVENLELEAFKTRLRAKQDELAHDRETGFFNKRGKDTVNEFDNYSKSYQDYIQEELKGLGSETLRNKANLVAEGYTTELKRNFNRHTSKEMERYYDSQTEANLKSLSSHAALNYKEYGLSNSKVAESLQNQKAIIEDYATRKGLSSAEKEQMVVAASSSLHEGVIKQALNNGEDLLAQDYFKEVRKRGEVSGESAVKMEGMLRQASIRGESQRLTDKMFSEGRSLGDALDYIRKTARPEVRQEAVRLYRSRYEEKKYIEKERVETEGDKISETILKYKTDESLTPEQRFLIDNSPGMKKNYEELRKLTSKGYVPDTDRQFYDDYLTKAALAMENPKMREEFFNISLAENTYRLSPQHKTELVKLRNKIRSGATTTEDKSRLKSHQSTNAMLKSKLEEAKISSKDDQAKFMNRVHEEIALRQERGDKLTPADQIEIADKYLKEHITDKGWIWDTTKRTFELQEGDTIVIPTDFRDQVQRVYRKKGRTATEKDIRDLYQQRFMGR